VPGDNKEFIYLLPLNDYWKNNRSSFRTLGKELKNRHIVVVLTP